MAKKKTNPPAPVVKPTAASLLAGLAAKTPTAPKAKPKEARPELPLPAAVQTLFAKFVPAKKLFDVFEANLKVLKDELYSSIFDLWTANLWRNKSVPSSPMLQANVEGVHSEGMFVVQERWKVEVPDNDANVLVALLGELGVADADAQRLVASEVSLTPQVGLRPFTELVEGHYGKDRQFVEATDAEKAVGQKLLEYVTANLTAEEQSLVVTNTAKVVVKGGFLQRVCSYVHSKDQLLAVLKVIKPVIFCRSEKFATNMTLGQRTEMLIQESQATLEGSEEEE